jgi:chromosome segregation ATPase
MSLGKSPITESDALSEMSEKADREEVVYRQKIEEARKLRQQKIEEEQNYSDEERESGGSGTGSRTNTPKLTGPINKHVHSTDGIVRSSSNERSTLVNGMERESVFSVQERLIELQTKCEDAMVSNAQLYNEKSLLNYTVDKLKDRIEELMEEQEEAKVESQKHLSRCHKLQHQVDTLQQETSSLKALVKQRDDFLESRGVHLPLPGEEGEDGQEISLMNPAEREELLQQIKDLKNEVSSLKSNGGQGSEALAGQDQKDIVRESTKLVMEYKSKLQIAEAERQRLEGTIQRLEHQTKRFKGQVENLEKREDELIEEKRKQNREIRKLQQEIDELKTDNELLQKRIEGLRKRQQT